MNTTDHTPEQIAPELEIITIQHADAGEEFDYDFDYDPNEMYYALHGENN